MHQNDDDDKQAFREAMQGVTRLPHKKTSVVINPKTKPTPKPTTLTKTSSAPKRKSVASRLNPTSPLDSPRPTVVCPQPYLPEVSAEDTLSYRDPSINGLSWRRFKTGQFGLEQRLDLHGLTLIEAEQALEALLLHAGEIGAQHLLIIHGKGSHDGKTMPVLKNWLWRWLRHCPRVLAIHSAPKHQGGTGAVLVWLKKK